jgi:hypothetical protein
MAGARLASNATMATPNQAGVSDTDRLPRTEERAPSDRRADKGVIGVLVVGVVLAALDFAGRGEQERNQPPVDRPAPAQR